MNVSRTEALSPAWFETKWLGLELQLTRNLGALIQRLPAIGSIGLLVVGLAWYWLLHSYCARYSTHFGDRIWIMSEVVFYALLLFALAQLLRPSLQKVATRSAASIGIFTGAFLVFWAQGIAHGTLDVVTGIAFVWLTVPLVLLAAHTWGRLNRGALLILLTLEFAILPSIYAGFLSSHSIITSEVWYLVWTDRLIIPFVVVLSEATSIFNITNFSLLFNPVSFFYVLPLSRRNFEIGTPYSILLAAAMIGFVRLIFFKMMEVQLENYLLAYRATNPTFGLWTFWYAWLMYLETFLFSYVGLNLGIALGRCLGLSLEDGTHFSLLAVSPLDRWRRWNSYYYGWLFRFIFVPVYRKIRNSLIAILAVFFATFLLHSSRALTVLALPHSNFGLERWTLMLILFFQLHGFAVFSSSYLPKWTQDANSRRSWVGVIITHLVMTAIHIIPLWS